MAKARAKEMMTFESFGWHGVRDRFGTHGDRGGWHNIWVMWLTSGDRRCDSCKGPLYIRDMNPWWCTPSH